MRPWMKNWPRPSGLSAGAQAEAFPKPPQPPAAPPAVQSPCPCELGSSSSRLPWAGAPNGRLRRGRCGQGVGCLFGDKNLQHCGVRRAELETSGVYGMMSVVPRALSRVTYPLPGAFVILATRPVGSRTSPPLKAATCLSLAYAEVSSQYPLVSTGARLAD